MSKHHNIFMTIIVTYFINKSEKKNCLGTLVSNVMEHNLYVGIGLLKYILIVGEERIIRAPQGMIGPHCFENHRIGVAKLTTGVLQFQVTHMRSPYL